MRSSSSKLRDIVSQNRGNSGQRMRGMAEMADTNFINNKAPKPKRSEKTPAFNFMTDVDVKLPNIGSEASTIS